MITINQGKPSSPYFPVLQTIDADLLKIGKTVTCIHPRNKSKTLAKVVDVSTYLWAELPDMMILYLFGCNAQQVYEAFSKTIPEGHDIEYVKIFQLMEINKE